MDLQIGSVQNVDAARPAVQPAEQAHPKSANRREVERPDDAASSVDGRDRETSTGPVSYAQFRIDPETHRVQVRLIDQHTGDVLLEVPPETILRLAAELQRQTGVIFEAKR